MLLFIHAVVFAKTAVEVMARMDDYAHSKAEAE